MKIAIAKISVLLFILCAIPLFWQIWLIINNALGPDPAAELARKTGEVALIFLLITLTATPIQRFFHFRVVRYRRMLGLYAFFYAVIHLLVFLTFLLEWDISLLVNEIAERPYIVVGSLALLLMLPLALTSLHRMRRKLGRRWQTLHRLVYLVAALVLVHIWWQVRSDMTEAIFYSIVFVVLMLLRLRFVGLWRK